MVSSRKTSTDSANQRIDDAQFTLRTVAWTAVVGSSVEFTAYVLHMSATHGEHMLAAAAEMPTGGVARTHTTAAGFIISNGPAGQARLALDHFANGDRTQ